MIFDEVVTGIGQTGTMFACQYEGVTPDILVTGKGLTSGYVPGSAVLCRKEIGEDKYSLGQRLYEAMLENGLITELESHRNLENVVVVMHPALITSRENVEEAVEIIDKSLRACLK